MRIAFVHPAFRDYRSNLFDELNKKYDLQFIFTSQGKSRNIPPEWNHKMIRSDKLRVRGRSIIMHLKLVKELLRREHDIILASTSWYICFPIAKITGKKFIFLTEYWNFASDSFSERLLNMLTKFIAKHSDAVIATGTKPFEAHLGFGAKNEKIFKCIQPANDYSNLPTKDLRDELGLEGKKIILYLGRIVPRKGLDYLIEAFALLEEEIGVTLIVVGDGPFRGECEKLAKDLDLENVVFTGYAVDQASYYKTCDLFVLPAIFVGNDYEPWGLVINEAMAFGKPIVTTDAVGAAYDLVEDGYNGYVVENKDVRGLYEALHKILSNPELAKVMGENSRKIFEEKNDHEKMLETFVSAINYVHNRK